MKKLAICVAALLAATIASHLAQAGSSKGGGASSFAPGQQSFGKTGPTEPGKSQFAPGDIKKDTPGTSNAKELAPGDNINKSKK